MTDARTTGHHSQTDPHPFHALILRNMSGLRASEHTISLDECKSVHILALIPTCIETAHCNPRTTFHEVRDDIVAQRAHSCR